MKPIYLIRKNLDSQDEIEFLRLKGNQVVNFRSHVPEGSTVVCRYACLPFYHELEVDLATKGSKLLNTLSQHEYVANLENWYNDLSDLTFKTWFQWTNLPEGQYVVKGRTNGRKHQWNSRMFAASKTEAIQIAGELLLDSMISEQGVVIRQYEQLVQYDTGINGLPITNEWRFFVLDNKIMSSGYYWSNFPEYRSEYYRRLGFKTGDVVEAPIDAYDLVYTAIDRIGDKCRFYVIDVAERIDGTWVIVELNDAQMSGLSENDMNTLYSNINKQLLITLDKKENKSQPTEPVDTE